jgi:hypothetical protein
MIQDLNRWQEQQTEFEHVEGAYSESEQVAGAVERV